MICEHHHLPRLIKTAQKANLDVLWFADTLHGNIKAVFNSYKTRRFENISGVSTRLF